jgi:hypothetical protein
MADGPNSSVAGTTAFLMRRCNTEYRRNGITTAQVLDVRDWLRPASDLILVMADGRALSVVVPTLL